MEIIHIPDDAEKIIGTSSKGDQSKWRIGDKWVKQNTRGYEGTAFIYKRTLVQAIEASNIDFGRAKQVLLSQLNDPTLQRFFLERSHTND